MSDNDETLLDCPKCKARIVTYPDCRTYLNQRQGGMMRCTPTCGDTITYSCTSWECYWTYTKDLHPMNVRYDQNLRNKPEWLLA